MPASHRLALALALASLSPAANAMDDFVSAIGSAPMPIGICRADDTPMTPAACKQAGFDTLVTLCVPKTLSELMM
jgi:hypothetical protein